MSRPPLPLHSLAPSPKARDRQQRTPLALAASYNRTEAVKALLAAGADSSAIDEHGQSAKDAAGENVDVVAAFEQHDEL